MNFRTFRRVLVANRGEIAVRIIRGCHERGLEAVAVYSEPDAEALHVRLADAAYGIGPAASSESYLRVDKLLEVARRSGCDAVHPGYGFLSENAAFAQAVLDAGLVWIGPPPSAIIAMGSKTGARRVMDAAGVPVVPGTLEAVRDDAEALRIALEIGYPVMLKASAGGGGKGMRAVFDDKELRSALLSARSEAQKSFGDDAVYFEKLVVRPRHVEIQVLADGHGNVVHLFERDCSIQRRHQKVIEEAPCPALDPETRRAMAEAQLRVAAGEPLWFGQDDLAIHGHAIECRIYAEDPAAGFRPAPGPLRGYREPNGPGVRVDSGVVEGMEVPIHYDPMVAKLVVWGADREQAIRRARRALRHYHVVGIPTSIPFFLAVLDDEDFLAGRYATDFISPEWLDANLGTHDDAEVVAVAAAIARFAKDAAGQPREAEAETSAWKRGHRWNTLRRGRA